jgi:acyl-CoA reductase-like NAD-dependent aldehyde dehydrogenase
MARLSHLAGNSVVFKPSPLAANVGRAYATKCKGVLPRGVFELVQGWADPTRALPPSRFTPFASLARSGRVTLAKELAAEYGKSLALELGGRERALVFGTLISIWRRKRRRTGSA